MIKKKTVKRAAAAVLGLCLLMANLGTAWAAPKKEIPETPLPSGTGKTSIGVEIADFVKDHEETMAAMEVAVFDREKVLYRGYFGDADKENGLAAGSETVFEWGSATKLLVWVSVMQLWERDQIDLEADVRDYLPGGFLTNLTFDTPVTVTDLMNHQAGFQEMLTDLFLKDEEDVLDLGDQLMAHEPEQIYEPGTVTAYSNWGVALAAYIVEQVSGQPFSEYVAEHIFQPLGMSHTAIKPDLSDNPWVQDRRKQLQCYTAEGSLIEDCFYHISLYPAGMCTGTLEDFLTFGRALLPEEGEKSPLFKKKSTLKTFFSPTAWYGDTEIPLNCHGMWTLEYGVQVVGHGGNTAGCSSYLLLDPASGTGMVIMTNQQYESVFNEEMPALVFGAFADSDLADYNGTDDVPGGFWRSARVVLKGPMSVSSVGFLTMTEEDLDQFWVYSGGADSSGGSGRSGNGQSSSSGSGSNGNGEDGEIEKVTFSYGDLVRLSAAEYIPMVALVVLVAAAAAYCLVTLVIGGCIIRPIRRRKERARAWAILSAPPVTMDGWNYLACGIMTLLMVNVAVAAYRAMSYASSASYGWQFMVCGLLLLIMILLEVVGVLRLAVSSSALRDSRLFDVFRMRKLTCKRGKRAKYVFTAFFLLVLIAAVCYWQLYAFWKL